MDEDLQSWVQQVEKIPGVLACGARRANQSFSHSCHTDYPQAQFDKLMREVAESIRLLQTNRIPTERLRWTFEHAWVYSTLRRDGAIATVVVDKQAETSSEVERLLAEFQAPAPGPAADQENPNP